MTLLAVATALVPRLVHSWGGTIPWNIALSVLLVAIAMSGFFKIIQSNIALAAARAEVARLAAENERSRIARDLHDLLGHSLTTITVKAGLARRRLAEHGDVQRAFTEISEVEQLSRRTLGDVRAAVSAHREVTLAGELATAREVLRAAGVISELPASVAETDPALSELFGWVVREGVTNVVRHSHGRAPADHPGPRLHRDRRRRPGRRRVVQRQRHRRAARAGRGARRHAHRGRRVERLPAAGRGAGPVGVGPPAAVRPRRRRRAGTVIRLLLADDQTLVRTALAALLELEDDFEVVAQVGRGDEVVQAALQARPDVALLDIEMPGVDGLAAAAALAHELPRCKVIMLTAFGRPGYLRRAMEAGASGFVVKDAPAEQLADAVRRVAQGAAGGRSRAGGGDAGRRGVTADRPGA